MFKNFTKISLTILLISFFINSACDAPRNNPLDPLNPDNNLALLEGNVYSALQPAHGVDVFWANENILSKTNGSGYFKIENILAKDGWLFFEKNGYSYDSTHIAWGNIKQISVQFTLNAIPKLDSLEFYSVVENKYPNRQSYQLIFRVRISDADGDNEIDSVFIENAPLKLRENLDYNLSTKFHEIKFDMLDLNILDIDEVIGKDFEIIIYDNAGRNFNIGSSNVKRIIKDEIEFISPADNDTVSLPLTLKWKRFTPGFSFTYLLQIYTNEIDPELAWQRVVSSGEIFFTVESQIPGGEYFWVIWCVDEFLNRTRSKPATFQIF